MMSVKRYTHAIFTKETESLKGGGRRTAAALLYGNRSRLLHREGFLGKARMLRVKNEKLLDYWDGVCYNILDSVPFWVLRIPAAVVVSTEKFMPAFRTAPAGPAPVSGNRIRNR